MDSESIERFIFNNKKDFPTDSLNGLRQRLRNSSINNPEEIWSITKRFKGYKNPTLGLVLSLICVPFDRMYVGDYGLAFVKLITLGGFGFWGIADWFFIPKKCKELNLTNFFTQLQESEKNCAEVNLQMRAMELQLRAQQAKEAHVKQSGYDSYTAEIDRELYLLEQTQQQIEDDRKYNKALEAIEKSNKLIEESNRIAERHAQEEEFWHIMNHYK